MAKVDSKSHHRLPRHNPYPIPATTKTNLHSSFRAVQVFVLRCWPVGLSAAIMEHWYFIMIEFGYLAWDSGFVR